MNKIEEKTQSDSDLSLGLLPIENKMKTTNIPTRSVSEKSQSRLNAQSKPVKVLSTKNSSRFSKFWRKLRGSKD